MRKKLYIIIAVTMFAGVILSGCGNKSDGISLSTDATSGGDFANATSSEMQSGAGNGEVYVYVLGEVKKPGVYKVVAGTRLYVVIDMAGGLTDKASRSAVNLAEEVHDGQQINILSKKQAKKLAKSEKSSATPGESGNSGDSSQININTATADELTKLQGIGEARAAAIIDYRTKNGGFKSIEDIKNVSGIGDATFNNIKSSITV